jgi:ribonuclease HI
MTAAALTIHIDGASRGNPGPAAFAYVITSDGQPAIETSGCLGKTTNNVAEYTALLRALERAQQLGARRIHIRSDSELLVKQMNGEYRVKNPDLQVLYEEARQLCGRFETVGFTHVRREQNRDADRLCNEALDGGKPAAAPASRSKAAPKASGARIEAVRADALECLRSAATSWARGNAAVPRVEDVWDQLWSILEEEGVVRKPDGK